MYQHVEQPHRKFDGISEISFSVTAQIPKNQMSRNKLTPRILDDQISLYNTIY